MMYGPRLHGAISCNPIGGGNSIIALALQPDRRTTMAPPISYPVDALVSFHYYRSDTIMGPVATPGHLRLIGDSGAYSAYSQGKTITLPDYAAWIRQWRDALCWVAALDVLGDPAATFANWATFRDTYQIESIPTLHAGGDPRELDRYAAHGVDLVGLGGLVGIATRAMAWLIAVFRYARDRHPAMRFHLWGATNRKLLDNLPAWSADSSAYMGMSYRYGRLRLFDPATARDTAIPLDGRAVYQPRNAALLRRYGITPRSVERSGPPNRDLLVQVGAAATQTYAAWLQARHHVTPPSYGQHPGPDGTRLHVVGGSKGNANLELLFPTGPVIHVIGSQGPNDDLTKLHPDRTGTRVHATTTSSGALAGLAGPRLHLADTGDALPALTGTRLHVTDRDPGNLGPRLSPNGE
jgi:hypothetical protein